MRELLETSDMMPTGGVNMREMVRHGLLKRKRGWFDITNKEALWCGYQSSYPAHALQLKHA